MAQATAELLQAVGGRVKRVSNAQQALDHLDHPDNEAVDVVLSDIEMPGRLDGIALASQLPDRTPPVPVVLMTGYTARMEQAVSLGINVLPKPCSPQMLVAAIDEVLQDTRTVRTAGGRSRAQPSAHA